MSAEQSIEYAFSLMSEGSLDAAATSLNQALDQHPDNPNLHFLRAAIEAEKNDFDQAITSYRNAIRLDPELYIARFQLGLLYATLEQASESLAVLESSSWPQGSGLACYVKAIIAILREEDLTAATRWIESGLNQQQQNASLQADMQALLERLQTHLAENQLGDTTLPTQDSAQNMSHLLDVYNKKH